MASWLDLTDPSLEKGFNAPVYKPEPGRAQVVAMIDKAITQYQANPDSKAAHRVWKKGTNGGVSFAPKIKGKELILAGKETHFIRAEKFVDALKQLKSAVEGKEYDEDIKAALDSAPTAGGIAKTSEEKGTLAGLRRSIGRSLTNGRSLDEIEANLLAGSKYDRSEIKKVIAEKREPK